jgi:hypothetical protein
LKKGGGKENSSGNKNEIYGISISKTPKEVLLCQAKRKVTGVNF